MVNIMDYSLIELEISKFLDVTTRDLISMNQNIVNRLTPELFNFETPELISMSTQELVSINPEFLA